MDNDNRNLLIIINSKLQQLENAILHNQKYNYKHDAKIQKQAPKLNELTAHATDDPQIVEPCSIAHLKMSKECNEFQRLFYLFEYNLQHNISNEQTTQSNPSSDPYLSLTNTQDDKQKIFEAFDQRVNCLEHYTNTTVTAVEQSRSMLETVNNIHLQLQEALKHLNTQLEQQQLTTNFKSAYENIINNLRHCYCLMLLSTNNITDLKDAQAFINNIAPNSDSAKLINSRCNYRRSIDALIEQISSQAHTINELSVPITKPTTVAEHNGVVNLPVFNDQDDSQIQSKKGDELIDQIIHKLRCIQQKSKLLTTASS